MASKRIFSAEETLEMLQKTDDCDSGGKMDFDDSWSAFSFSSSESESEPPRLKKIESSLAGGCGALVQVPQSAQVQRQGDEPGAQCPAINPAIQLPGRRETTNQAFSLQDERTLGKEEQIVKDGTVWTLVGEEESKWRRQSQNLSTEAEGPTMYAKRQIQDAQTVFLNLVDAEMLIYVQGFIAAEACRVLGNDSCLDMSVDELKAFLALVYVHVVKGGRNMELSSF
ncbi:hypothetical protein ILYODFUR_035970 [Ilyodon furcidens]|uniref:Uncharacterized protein n=1 Tax=Ilyodon furcidens TaxID=33524 RepID=A0ABV0UFC9_9TELE